MRTCAFASQLSPPPRIRVLRSTKLCCEAEDENSFDRHAVAVLKATYVAILLAGNLAARLLPTAATAG